MDFRDTLKGVDSLSHAYMIEGAENMRDALLGHLSSIGFTHTGHPDAFVRTYEAFGIDESREITIRATRKPVSSVRNMFVITTPTMTREAQNALLKTFEEPSSVTTFFLITPSVEVLLPTLRSRMQLLVPTGVASEVGTVSVSAFLSATPASRLKLIEPLLKERKAGEVISFLGEVERALAGALTRNPQVEDGLRAVYRAQDYGRDKGSLLKVLLEQVALLCPQM